MKTHSKRISWVPTRKGGLLLCLASFCMFAFSPAKAVVQISMNGNILQFEFVADGTNYYTFSDIGIGTFLTWGSSTSVKDVPSKIDYRDVYTINLVNSKGENIESLFRAFSSQPTLNGNSYSGIAFDDNIGSLKTVKSGILQYNLAGYGYESYHLPAASVPTLNNGSYTGSDPTLKPVPEPSTYAMIGAGVLGLLAMRRRRA